MDLVLVSALYALSRLLLDLLLVRWRPQRAHEIELLALRQEVRVLRRQAKRTRWQPGDRLVLATLSRCLARRDWGRFPVRPETLLRWHRALTRRKWAAFGRRRGPGRPPLPDDLSQLVQRWARETPTWGYQRIPGELLKLGHSIGVTTIRSILQHHRIPPAPRRGGLAWGAFLRAQARGVLACDVFVVEDLRLRTLDVLFFLARRTRRVFLAGCTDHPTAAWTTQQARTLAWTLEDAGLAPTILVRDRDAKFTGSFDAVFASAGIRVVHTPVRAPRANAVAERWVGTVRREGLDWVLILDRGHREQVLREYVEHDNAARPHRSLGLRPPLGRDAPPATAGPIVRHDRVSGLIHEYERRAA